MEPVKISSLELENVKRIRAVEITPTKNGLTVIGGRNGQGKTSVLDAIAWALGGNKRKPANPNRDGAAMPAKLHVELSNGIVVERKGKNGTLHVTDTTGMKGTQRLLDEFLSQLALDLPKFMGGTDKDRTDALLQTLGIDQELARIDGEIRNSMQERTLVGREAKTARAHAESLPYHDDAPAEEVSAADLIRQQQDILARNGENQRKRENVAHLEWELHGVRQEISRAYERIETLKEELDSLKEQREMKIGREAKLMQDLVVAKKTAEQLVDESTAEIERSIESIETINAHVRDNQRKADAETAAKEREARYDELTSGIESLRASRVALLEGAPLPLDGLSLDDEGRMTYLGQTWGDMSGSERLRVATSIVHATKPDCGFVLLDGLEQMDAQTLAEFGEWAREQGLQVIGARVGTDSACTIIIEDGRVEGQDMPEPTPPDPKGQALSWGGETF